MSSTVILNGGIDLPTWPPGSKNLFERLILILFAGGMLSSVVVFITAQQALRSQYHPGVAINWMAIEVIKPPVYYLAHALEITLLVSAGLLALVFTKLQTIERNYVVKFTLLVGAALLMTARGYTLTELLSMKLADESGPCPFLMSLLVFVGATRSNWSFLSKVFAVMAVFFSVLVLVGITHLRTFTRDEAIIMLRGALNALYWPASWLVLRPSRDHSFGARLRFAPILIYGLGSFFTQIRLNFVMLFALLAIHCFSQRKRRRPQALAWIIGLTVTVWLVLFSLLFLRETGVFETMNRVADAFESRLDEDTRTGQLTAFMDNVAPRDLILGTGSFGAWQWGNVLWGGADLGYLTLLFYGGIPLFLTYFMTHLQPCFKILKNNSADLQLTAAGIIFLWSIGLFSSNYPSMQVGYYFVLLCVGACISRTIAQPGRHSLGSDRLLV